MVGKRERLSFRCGATKSGPLFSAIENKEPLPCDVRRLWNDGRLYAYNDVGEIRLGFHGFWRAPTLKAVTGR